MKKYIPSDEDYVDHIERTAPVPRGKSVSYKLARTDPVYFVVNQLGIRPYVWQVKFLDNLAMGKNTLACTSRQIGKTATLAWFALWACTYNTLPMTSTKKTRIVFVSKSEGQSQKLISDIREFMRLGDENIFNITGGKVKEFFSSRISKDANATNTKAIITFANGCQILSLPPTDSARGYTGSQLFIDEMAFVPDEIISKVLFPIVSSTGNKISGTSTPNGRQGLFYKYFDPDDEQEYHEFDRLWLSYETLILDDPQRTENARQRKIVAISTNEEKDFSQEYEADFNASSSSFFDAIDVDAAVYEGLFEVDSYKSSCDMGIDFGKEVSRTVVTISALEKKDGVSYIRLLHQKEYPAGQDLSLERDVEEYMDKFKIERIVAEDCPQSSHFQQVAQLKGWPIYVFNPSRDKNKKYVMFRAWLRQRKVRMPKIPELIKQMNGLIQEETPRTTKLYHGAGLLDDRIDSFMLSTNFFTEESKGFRAWEPV